MLPCSVLRLQRAGAARGHVARPQANVGSKAQRLIIRSTETTNQHLLQPQVMTTPWHRRDHALTMPRHT